MWPNPQETKDLVAFTEEIFNGFPSKISSINATKSVQYWFPDAKVLPASAHMAQCNKTQLSHIVTSKNTSVYDSAFNFPPPLERLFEVCRFDHLTFNQDE